MNSKTEKHTPGAWVARQFTTGNRFDWIVEAPGTDEIGYSSGIPARIARIEGLDFNNDEPFRYIKEERDEANARLIAAAPELLTELCDTAQSLAFMLGAFGHLLNDSDKIAVTSRLKSARDAIAKAEGRA